MKGIIFNLAEEVLVSAHGEDVWDEVLEASGLDGAYTSLGSYPDGELVALVTGASKVLGADAAAVVRAIGEGAIPLLAERYPAFFDHHDSARSFVLTVNDIIHPEVRKLYPGADVPEFTFDLPDADTVTVGYRSHRRLCFLAEGFIAGAARHYGERVVIDQTACMLSGADHCAIHCRFEQAAAGLVDH